MLTFRDETIIALLLGTCGECKGKAHRKSNLGLKSYALIASGNPWIYL